MSDKSILGSTKGEKAVSIVAIVVSVLVIPMLLINCILIIASAFNPEKIPSIGKNIPLIVLTESMEPEIHDGDLIVCKMADVKSITEGDVISYYDPDGNGKSIVTHRVIGVTENNGSLLFETQGDNNNIKDRYPVPEENVIGVWTGLNIRFLGSIIMFMQSTLGLILCIAVPILVVVVVYMVNKKRSDNVNKRDIEALKAELEALKSAKESEVSALAENTSSEKESGEGEQPSQNGTV